MTTIIETLDGNEIETGFWSGDVSKIQLGELPPMSTQQFVGYAAMKLSQEIIPKMNPETRAEWQRDFDGMCVSVEEAPVLHITGKYVAHDPNELVACLTDEHNAPSEEDRAELWEDIGRAATPIGDEEYYRDNPFIVQPDGQRVGFTYQGEVRHVIAAEDFFNLTYSIMQGGLMGWGKRGTYPEVKEAIRQIASGFSRPVLPAPADRLELPAGPAAVSVEGISVEHVLTALQNVLDLTGQAYGSMETGLQAFDAALEQLQASAAGTNDEMLQRIANNLLQVRQQLEIAVQQGMVSQEEITRYMGDIA